MNGDILLLATVLRMLDVFLQSLFPVFLSRGLTNKIELGLEGVGSFVCLINGNLSGCTRGLRQEQTLMSSE